MLSIALPPGTPEETEVAVRRLVELTSVLARRCAQLQEALDSRVVIEQAKGILAERFHLEPDRAFDVLRRSARSNRVSLRDLAARVVASERTPWEVAAQLDGAAVPPRLARTGSR
jgi:AmiR/NasT family two-component response regulator